MPPGWPGGQCCGAGGSGLRAAGGGCALGAAAASGGGAETSACAASALAMRPSALRVSALHVQLARAGAQAAARRRGRSCRARARAETTRRQKRTRRALRQEPLRQLHRPPSADDTPQGEGASALDCAARSAPPAARYTLAPVPAACAALARCCERRHARAAGAVTRPAAACQRRRLGGCAINGRWRLRRRRRRARS